MDREFGWGFLGAGSIASDFATVLRVVKGARLAAVASSDQNRAKNFAEKFGFEKFYDSYDSLVKDENVHVIYCNRTHNFHAEDVERALTHNKHVLCEKAFTLNAHQLSRLVKIARERNLFLMEGMWTRFFPATRRVIDVIQSGEIGKIKLAQLQFGFDMSKRANERLYDPRLGGGALLDLGVYPVSWSEMVFGCAAKRVAAFGSLSGSGADTHVTGVIDYGDERHSSIAISFHANYDNDAVVIGEKGSVRVHGNFHSPSKITIRKEGHDEVTEEFPLPDIQKMYDNLGISHEVSFNFGGSQGLLYEAEHVMHCLRHDLKESPLISLDDSEIVMHILDEMRRRVGVEYDADSHAGEDHVHLRV